MNKYPTINIASIYWFDMASLFNDISTFVGYLMANLFSKKNSWEDKGVYTFPKSICPKVNVIARLEYKLAYYDSAVHRFNHYTTRTTLQVLMKICLNFFA